MRLWSLSTALLLLTSACADPSIESTTDLESTQNSRGPYQIQSIVHGANTNDSVELFYNAVDNTPERYIPIRMQPVDNDGQAAELFTANIPGQPTGSTVFYYVAIEREGARVSEDPVGGDLAPYELTIVP